MTTPLIPSDTNKDTTMDSTIEILTTLPHYAAVLPMIGNTHYAATVLIGTSASVLYHTYPDHLAFTVFDHVIAALWFLMDMIYSSQDDTIFQHVLMMNVFIFGWWASLPPDFHAFWHLLSAIKCYSVSLLLQRLDQARKNRNKLYDEHCDEHGESESDVESPALG